MRYIKYEVEQNELWSRPYLVGVYINDAGKTVRDWLLGFGSKINNNEAKIELERIADMYNAMLSADKSRVANNDRLNEGVYS